MVLVVFFFKQKTAYEMRISDWSSDVCSSDLASGLLADELAAIDHDHDQAQQLWLRLPPPLTKGDRGRSVLVPRRLLRQIAAYVAVERAAGVPQFAARDGAAKLQRPTPVPRPGLDRLPDATGRAPCEESVCTY